MILDSHLPHSHASERHERRVIASPAATLAAARAFTPREVPLSVVLVALRTGRLSRSLDRPLLEGFERAGFVLLDEAADEVAYGVVGRFWTPTGGVVRVSAEEFASFAEPGYARAAFNFRVERDPRPGATLLSTETRILAADEAARRSFLRYWRVIHPGSALIRRVWLRAIARRAAQTSAESASSSPSTSASVV